MNRVVLSFLLLMAMLVPSAQAVEPIEANGRTILNVTGKITLEGYNAFRDFYRNQRSQFGDEDIIKLVFNEIAGATVPLTAATADFVVPKRVMKLRKFIDALKQIEYRERAGSVANTVQGSTDVIQFIGAVKSPAEAAKLIEAINVLQGVKQGALPYEIEMISEIKSLTPEITLLPTSTPKPTKTPGPPTATPTDTPIP